jgi:hypothetical protein
MVILSEASKNYGRFSQQRHLQRVHVPTVLLLTLLDFVGEKYLKRLGRQVCAPLTSVDARKSG